MWCGCDDDDVNSGDELFCRMVDHRNKNKQIVTM